MTAPAELSSRNLASSRIEYALNRLVRWSLRQDVQYLILQRAGVTITLRSARHALIQTHCHQHAIMGFDADEKLLADMGIDAEVLDFGCCRLAGNFGFERGHYEVSEACCERAGAAGEVSAQLSLRVVEVLANRFRVPR